MDEIIALLFLIGIAVLVIPIIAIIVATKASSNARQTNSDLTELKQQLADLQRLVRQSAGATKEPPLETKAAIPPARSAAKPEPPQQANIVEEEEKSTPPPRPPKIEPVSVALESAQEPAPVSQTPPPAPSKPAFSLEQFMGVKLFAWLGGVAMFFGVIFFVKYAFERNLIPPAVRVALGFITGLSLVVGGLWIHRRKAYTVLAQSLSATGVLVLYGVSFAAHALYQFPAFSPLLTFALMSLVTVAAFLIAVRLNAQVVAALGMIGGFLSPILLPSVQDNPFALFSYIALLNIGVLATTRYRYWKFLPAAAALGTILILLQWHSAFFVSGDYGEGIKTLIPLGILLFFALLFGVAAWDKKRSHPSDIITSLSTLAMNSSAILFAFGYLAFVDIANRPFLLYGFIFALNLIPLALANIEPRISFTRVITGLATFLHLAMWSATYLTTENLTSALTLYLTFGVLHAGYPVILQRLRKQTTQPAEASYSSWFLPLSLLLIGLAVAMQDKAPMSVWAVVLIVDIIVIFLAALSGAVLVVIGSLILTLFVAVVWLFEASPSIELAAPFLAIIVIFGALFTVAGLWLNRRQPDTTPNNITPRSAIPILSAALPFGLLILATLQLPLSNPSPIFGVALLFSLILLGLMVIGRQPSLALLALLCTLAVEAVWHLEHYESSRPWLALGWYLGFYALFTVFPFVCRKACDKCITPWAACALSGVGHFILVHEIASNSFSNQLGSVMGIIPVAFAIPSIAALMIMVRRVKEMDAISKSQIAWIGGVALLFITLIFPIQLDRQWLTVSWALEGAALIWLFLRIPHNGLKWTGIALLTIAFARLTLNPAVFSNYPRSGTAIFNWHLYAYGLVAASVIAGAKLLPRGHGKFGEIPVRGLLYAFGGILLFLLLNIEIADFFTAPGDRFITFEFSGNFARDMTYSIAWGIFSLGLLGIGIHTRNAAPRYAAIGLLVITLLKVFTHDLATIESIFRIGALIGVAITAFIASFLYQRFYSRSDQH